MPGYQAHVAGGCGAFLFALWVIKTAMPQLHLSPFVLPFMGCLTIMGALFPDIDIHSTGQGMLYRILLIAIPMAILLQHWYLLTGLIMLSILPLVLTHRGLTHNVWVLLCIPAVPWYFYEGPYRKILLVSSAFFTIGAFSHILLDFGIAKLVQRSFRFKRSR